MPQFLKNRPFIITVAIAIVLSLLMIFTSGNSSTVVGNGIGAGVTPVQGAFDTFSNAVGDFFSNIFNPTKAEAENVELKKQIAQLQEDSAQLRELQKENERLKELLGFVEENTTFTTVPARVVGKNPGFWFEMFEINVGRSQGVDKDMAVVNSQGLVGRVVEVGANWSKVLAVIDPRSSVAALLERSRDNGMVHGMLDTEESTGLCQMYYLHADADVLPGDKIITSGLGGVFPKGLLVGEVVEIGNQSESEQRRVMVKSAVDFTHLEEVLVIRQEAGSVPQG
ncbi:MAG: rod shape-determining protein MreC [Bacillota bacterium]|nr:rod shape-determining protein MreC [Bacillota bacterium]